MKDWDENYKEYNIKYKKNEKYNTYLSVLLIAAETFAPIMVLVFGASLVKKEVITIGELIAFFALTQIFYSQIYGVFNNIQEFIRHIIFVERLGDILCTETIEDNNDKKKIDLIGNIHISDVSFQYNAKSEYVLKNIDIKIRSGEKVAIVGKSGSGKSTLLK